MALFRTATTHPSPSFRCHSVAPPHSDDAIIRLHSGVIQWLCPHSDDSHPSPSFRRHSVALSAQRRRHHSPSFRRHSVALSAQRRRHHSPSFRRHSVALSAQRRRHHSPSSFRLCPHVISFRLCPHSDDVIPGLHTCVISRLSPPNKDVILAFIHAHRRDHIHAQQHR